MERIDFAELRLTDSDGTAVSLREQFERFALMICLRHLAWLACQDHLREVIGIQGWLAERGVTVVVVSFAKPEVLKRYQQALHWPVTILADPKRTFYRAAQLERLSLWRLFQPRMFRLYWNLLRKGHHLQHYGRDDIYQAGGDLLLNADGEILFSHRSHDPGDRPSIESIEEAVSQART